MAPPILQERLKSYYPLRIVPSEPQSAAGAPRHKQDLSSTSAEPSLFLYLWASFLRVCARLLPNPYPLRPEGARRLP